VAEGFDRTRGRLVPHSRRGYLRRVHSRRLLAIVLGALAAGACGDNRPPAERVQAFCSGVKAGEDIEAVEARFPQYGLQPGGVLPDPTEKVKHQVAPDKLAAVSGLLAEPARSPEGPRPVCAIVYSDRLLDGTNEVLFAEFREAWTGRY
jgi:hypothetical protein